ncbi:MAG: hypothetical protein IJB04_00770 [Oscillospiraceae bacterium]|nr:hypothetical protein [Oscillospiraceae bacterium]
MENFWDYSVWGWFNVLAVLLMSLLAAKALKKVVPILNASLIPTSVLGGGILLIVAGVYKLITGNVMFDEPFFGASGTTTLEIITYHCLALGFVASTLKAGGGKMGKKRAGEILNTGVTTVSTYLLQAVVGFGITMIVAAVIDGFFPAAGILLPFGFGQGTGQAMNYGNIYELEYGFVGGKSFGLTIAALGFLSASLGGVAHLYYLKKKGHILDRGRGDSALDMGEIQAEGEIPMQESMDKITVQLAFIALAYFIAQLMIIGLAQLIPGMKSVIYGFNFLLGVAAAAIVKAVLNFLNRKGFVRRKHTNDFLMTRCSNFFYDLMVVAGVAAIRLGILESYWGVMLILGVAGLIVTYIYNLTVAKRLFPEYPQEQFLMMYGMLTGTASTGVILLREIDGDFKTPAADNMVYQNLPAIALGFPMMLLATLAPKKPALTMVILVVFFLALQVVLFRSYLFKRKKK